MCASIYYLKFFANGYVKYFHLGMWILEVKRDENAAR